MGMYVSTCAHCDFADFLDRKLTRCPQCGAAVKNKKSAFEAEHITVTITTTRNRKNKVRVSFKEMSERVKNIIGNSLDKTLPDKNLCTRVIYMLQVYTWIILKRAPQLWIYLDIIVTGIKELMTLRMDKEKEIWLEKQKTIWYDNLTRDQAEKRLRQISIIEDRMKAEGRMK